MARQVQRTRIIDLTTFPATVFFFLLLCKSVASDSGSSMSSCMSNYTESINNKTGLVDDKFKVNLQTLLTDLTSASASKSFYNTTAGEPPNKSYGIYLCRGDVTSSELCHSCVTNLTQWVASYDGNCTERLAYTDYCMFRYANYSFFGRADYRALGYSYDKLKPSQAYNRTLEGVVEQVISLAAYNSTNLFATYEQDVDEHERVYALAQCTPDIDRRSCSKCLKAAQTDLKYEDAKLEWAMLANCQLRYDNASFVLSPAASSPAPCRCRVSAILVATWTLVLVIWFIF